MPVLRCKVSLRYTGSAAAKVGDHDQAIAVYTKSIELGPDEPLAYYKRGNLRKDRDQLEAALADYDRAISLNPGYAYALCNRGVVLSRLKLRRIDEYTKIYERYRAGLAPAQMS